MKSDSGGRECSPSRQRRLLSKPCHRDLAQLTALRTSLWATQSPWRHPLPCPVVSWSHVVSVAPLGQGPGSLWTPRPPPSLASVSQGLWEFTLQRTCGCCPSPALRDLCFPLPVPPGLPDNLPVFGFYRKRLFGGNFSLGPITMSPRRKRANAWFPSWTQEPEIQNKTPLTSI